MCKMGRWVRSSVISVKLRLLISCPVCEAQTVKHMRPFLVELLGCGFLLAGVSIGQEPPKAGASAAGPRLSATATNVFYDEWNGIAQATNRWATAIRNADGWSTINIASFDEARTRAEKGQAVAQLKLGYCYFTGTEVPRDHEAAVKWLSKAAESDFAPAQFLLAVASLKGEGLAKDFAGGVDWLNKAASQDFADAEFQLGLCYLSGGPGVNQAPTRGVKWLIKAAEQGKPLAQQCVGECYSTGDGVTADPVEAATWYRRAAEQGLPSAQDLLAGCYANGHGVTKDGAEAVKWYRLAAEQGLTIAQANLARCYASGNGVSRDLSAAADWWRKAAERNHPGARFHLALCYFQGEGVNRKPEEAVKLFETEARDKHVGAELFLGLCYWKGLGVEKDSAEAEKWWREAALQGIKPWQYAIGDETGGDVGEVEQWWRQVAAQANPALQSCMGDFYHFGHGVAQNDQEAIKWYRQAADQGDLAALKQAAWLRATSLNPAVRDASSAVEFAEKAAALTKQKEASVLDILAAAYAEAGQFDKAVKTEQQAVSLSRREDEQKEFEARLKMYQDKKPYRAPGN